WSSSPRRDAGRWTPSSVCRLAPPTSASARITRRPIDARYTATFAATTLLPTPPLAPVTEMTRAGARGAPVSSFAAASSSSPGSRKRKIPSASLSRSWDMPGPASYQRDPARAIGRAGLLGGDRRDDGEEGLPLREAPALGRELQRHAPARPDGRLAQPHPALLGRRPALAQVAG